jgi:hypothetical protein
MDLVDGECALGSSGSVGIRGGSYRQVALSDQRPGAAAIASCQVAVHAMRWGPSKGRSRAGPEHMAHKASAAKARCTTFPSIPCASGTHTPHSPWRSGRCRWASAVGDAVRSTAAMLLAETSCGYTLYR